MSDDRVLHDFLTDDGRLHTTPSKRAKLLVVLDQLLTREAGRYRRSGGTVDV